MGLTTRLAVFFDTASAHSLNTIDRLFKELLLLLLEVELLQPSISHENHATRVIGLVFRRVAK